MVWNTHVNEILSVAEINVVENGAFVQVCKGSHVLHTGCRSGVHWEHSVAGDVLCLELEVLCCCVLCNLGVSFKLFHLCTVEGDYSTDF